MESIQIGEHVRIFNPNEHDGLIKSGGCALELHRVRHGFPSRACHTRRALIDRGVVRLRYVEYAAWFRQANRIAALIQHVSRNALRGTLIVQIEWFNLKAIRKHTENDTAPARINRALATAFCNLCRM